MRNYSVVIFLKIITLSRTHERDDTTASEQRQVAASRPSR